MRKTVSTRMRLFFVSSLAVFTFSCAAPQIEQIRTRNSTGIEYNDYEYAQMWHHINELKKGDSQVQGYAAAMLSQSGKIAVNPLIELLENKRALVRSYAAMALGRIGDERAVPALVEALSDDDKGVQSSAAEALGEIAEKNPKVKTDSAKKLLVELLDYDETRPNAARALIKMGDLRGTVCLLIDEGLGDQYSHDAIKKLTEVGDEAIPYLVRAISHNDVWVGINAARVIEHIAKKNPSGSRLIEVSPSLLHKLRNTHWKIKESLESALESIGVPVIQMMVKTLKDDDKSMRLSASVILYEISRNNKESPEIENATPFIIEALKDSETNVKIYSIRTLKEIGDGRSKAAIMKALEDRSLRPYAIQALEEIGDPEALPLLKNIRINDREPSYRKAAKKAMDAIQSRTRNRYNMNDLSGEKM